MTGMVLLWVTMGTGIELHFKKTSDSLSEWSTDPAEYENIFYSCCMHAEVQCSCTSALIASMGTLMLNTVSMRHPYDYAKTEYHSMHACFLL